MKHFLLWAILAAALAACGKPTVDTAAATPPADAADFADALRENTHSGYARFISAHPGSRYVDLAIELYTEASILGDGAAQATVDNAEQALRADALPTSSN